MQKTIPALVAAFIITVILGVGMLLIGSDALVQATAAAAPASGSSSVEQTLTQYLVREGQYKDQLTKAQDLLNSKQAELDAANQKVTQYEKLVVVLQQVGVITVTGDGTIQINTVRR